ncbi:hypothetical protein [Staphylococcus simulans]
MNEKWYQKSWFVILMLIFLFPVGLFLMWYFKKWNNPIRWILTVIIVFISIFSIFDNSDEKEKNIKPKDEKSTQDKRTTNKDNGKGKKHKKENVSDTDIKHTKQNGYDVYTRDAGMPLSLNSDFNSMSVEMINLLKKDKEHINKGAIILNYSEMSDKKGHNSKMITSVTYFSKENLDDINFDDILVKDFYDIADGFVVHFNIQNDVKVKKHNIEEIPQEFYDKLGEEK